MENEIATEQITQKGRWFLKPDEKWKSGVGGESRSGSVADRRKLSRWPLSGRKQE